MPPVMVDLSKVLDPSVGRSFNPVRWVELTTSMRTLPAFEDSLRDMQFGRWLRPEPFEFLRQGGVVDATMCLIGDIVEVVVLDQPPAGQRQSCAHQSGSDAAQDGLQKPQVGSATAEPKKVEHSQSEIDGGAPQPAGSGSKLQCDNCKREKSQGMCG